MSNIHHLHPRPRDRPVLEALPEHARRALAIEFLASDRGIAQLVEACSGTTPEATRERAVLACVLEMVRDDAPQDLILADPALYRRLRGRITDMRLSGWIAPPR